MLSIASDKVCFIIVKARAFHVKEGSVLPDPASDPADDQGRDALASDVDDAVESELTGALSALNEEELANLVALLRLGRGEVALENWEQTVREARDGLDGATVRQLLAEPLLADHLEAGLASHGQGCSDEEREHL